MLGRPLCGLDGKRIVAMTITLEVEQLDDIAVSVERAYLEWFAHDSVKAVHFSNRVGERRAAKPNMGSALMPVEDVLGSGSVVARLEAQWKGRSGAAFRLFRVRWEDRSDRCDHHEWQGF